MVRRRESSYLIDDDDEDNMEGGLNIIDQAFELLLVTLDKPTFRRRRREADVQWTALLCNVQVWWESANK